MQINKTNLIDFVIGNLLFYCDKWNKRFLVPKFIWEQIDFRFECINAPSACHCDKLPELKCCGCKSPNALYKVSACKDGIFDKLFLNKRKYKEHYYTNVYPYRFDEQDKYLSLEQAKINSDDYIDIKVQMLKERFSIKELRNMGIILKQNLIVIDESLKGNCLTDYYYHIDKQKVLETAIKLQQPIEHDESLPEIIYS